MQELEAFLCSEEAQDKCKREMLYRKWSERVFAPVQRGLISQMEGPGCRELDARRRELFNKYLSYRNKKVWFTAVWVQEAVMVNLILCRRSFWTQSAVMSMTHWLSLTTL